MSLVGNFPGVYPTITDLSQVVTANSVTSCGYVGEAEFGPINTPTLVTNLKGYVDRFGELNSKYGYMGYSLAVAADTINTHYVVRVVNEETARYGIASVPKHGATVEQPEDGLTIKQVESAKKDSGSLFMKEEGGEIVIDQNSAFKIVSQNPNNKDIIVTVSDSTINTNKNYRAAKVTGNTTNGKVQVTIPEVDNEGNCGFEEGDTIIVTCQDDNGYDGTYTVESIEKTYYFVLPDNYLISAGTGYNVGDELALMTDEEVPAPVLLSDGTPLKIKVTETSTNGMVQKAILLATNDYNNIEGTFGTAPTTTGAGAKVRVQKYNVYENVVCFTVENPQYIIGANSKKYLKNEEHSTNTVSAWDDEATYNVCYTNGNTTPEVNSRIYNNAALEAISKEITTSGISVDDIVVDLTTFETYVQPTSEMELVFVYDGTATSWTLDSQMVSLSDYGITINSSVEIGDGDQLTIRYLVVTKVSAVAFTPDAGSIYSTPDKLRILKYPENQDTTFSIVVSESKNRVVEVVEKYNYVTLFSNKDQYGNSTFVEDVVNGRSNYIQIFVNPYIDSDENYTTPEGGRYIVDHNTSGEHPTATELIAGWKLFEDRSQTTVTLLMNCGYVNESEHSYQDAMLQIAEKRRDCFCLFDVPSTATEAEDVLDWRKNSQGYNTYRGAIFTPWVKTFDTARGKPNFIMCPSAYIAKIIGAAGKPWIAPAGPNRGFYTSSTVTPTGLTAYYDEDVGGTLYLNQLNCAIKDGGSYANWGQKTLQMKPSALDRMNVARTVIFIETTLRDAAKYHLFENNTAFERTQITMQFEQFLDEVLYGGGLSRYRVICDDSNNTPYIIAQNQLVIDIYLWPVYTTEFIALNTIVMGADAEITVSSNA